MAIPTCVWRAVSGVCRFRSSRRVSAASEGPTRPTWSARQLRPRLDPLRAHRAVGRPGRLERHHRLRTRPHVAGPARRHHGRPRAGRSARGVRVQLPGDQRPAAVGSPRPFGLGAGAHRTRRCYSSTRARRPRARALARARLRRVRGAGSALPLKINRNSCANSPSWIRRVPGTTTISSVTPARRCSCARERPANNPTPSSFDSSIEGSRPLANARQSRTLSPGSAPRP
jgi:hypothetical protein